VVDLQKEVKELFELRRQEVVEKYGNILGRFNQLAS